MRTTSSGQDSNDIPLRTPTFKDEATADQGVASYKYAAFISYSRAVDGKLAPALRDALHRFAKPWYRLRALRVFRDDASLSANPGLWSSIESALAASEFFILLASQKAAYSEWVRKEVDFWLTNKSTENLLVVLTDGPEPSSAAFRQEGTSPLPPKLREQFLTDEPRYIDLRWARVEEHLSLADGRFRDCVADLAATLHHRDKDMMTGEDVRQHRRTVRLARTVIAVLAVLLVLAASTAVVAINQRREAIQQLDLATARSLVAQAEQLRGRDVRSALKLDLAAERIVSNDETRNALAATLMNTQLAATITDPQWVGRIVFSSDGRTLASVFNDQAGGHGTIRIWNVSDGHSPRLTGTIPVADSQIVGDIAYSPDGDTLAVATDPAGLGGGGTVQLWSASDHHTFTRIAAVPISDSQNPDAVVFSPDGHTLAATTSAVGNSSGGTIQLWAVSDRRALTHTAAIADPGRVGSPAFSPDSHTLATAINSTGDGDTGGTIRLWDVSDGRSPVVNASVPVTDSQAVGDVAFSPDGHTLAATTDPAGSSGGGTIQLLDVSSGHAPSRTATVSVTEPLSFGRVAFSPDGQTLALAATNNSAGSSSNGGALLMWDVSSRTSLVRTTTITDPHQVETIAFSPNGSTLALGTDDGGDRGSSTGGTIQLWDFADRHTPTRTAIVTDPQNVTAAAYSPDGHTLATTSGTGRDLSGTIELWNVSNRHTLTRTAAITVPRSVDTIAFSSDGNRIVTTAGAVNDSSGTVQLWDVSDRRTITPVTAPQNVGTGVFSPDGRTFATAMTTSTGVGMIELWDFSDGHGPTKTATAQFTDVQYISGIVFSPDGHTLAVAVGASTAGTGMIELWDVTDRHTITPTATATAPQNIGAPVFSPDGNTLATTAGTVSDSSGTIQLWDVTDRHSVTLTATLTDPQAIGTAVFGPDDHTLAITTGLGARVSGGTVQVWDVGWLTALSGHLRSWACRAAGGGLSNDEWMRAVPGIAYQQTC